MDGYGIIHSLEEETKKKNAQRSLAGQMKEYRRYRPLHIPTRIPYSTEERTQRVGFTPL
jgi:hypothetical protein